MLHGMPPSADAPEIQGVLALCYLPIALSRVLLTICTKQQQQQQAFL